MKCNILIPILIAVSICTSCDNENRYEKYRKNNFEKTFFQSITEVVNFRGKNHITDLPNGRLYLQYYLFESKLPVKIRNEKKYNITEAGKVFDFIENKALVSTSDLQLLKLNKDKLKVWEVIKSGPGHDSGSNKVIKHITATTWILYLQDSMHRYLVVYSQQDSWTN